MLFLIQLKSKKDRINIQIGKVNDQAFTLGRWTGRLSMCMNQYGTERSKLYDMAIINTENHSVFNWHTYSIATVNGTRPSVYITY